MLCQHCNSNEANMHFVVSNGAQAGEVHLCEHCAQDLGRQYMQYMSRGYGLTPLAGGWAMFPQNAPTGTSQQQPPQQDEIFTRRRKLSELHARLQKAVADEDYEAAAALRDEIKTERRAIEAGKVKNLSLN